MPDSMRTIDEARTRQSADAWRTGGLVTEVSPAVAWSMIGLFLALLFGIPLFQAAVEFREGQPPGVLDLFASRRFPARADLRLYEESLIEQSQAIRFFQPCAQELLASWADCGTAQVVIGRDGWLFFRPGIDSITGPGFLETATIRRRFRNTSDAAATSPVSPDPRPAILEFQHQLEARGARLILMPVPDKASLQAVEFSGRRAAVAPVQNVSYARFVEQMRAAGVEVFDPAPAIVRPGEIRYLAQDTHWTPQWMDEAARELATLVRTHWKGDEPRPRSAAAGFPGEAPATGHPSPIPSPAPGETSALRLEHVTVSGVGDLADILRLTEDQQLFTPQTVLIQRVLDASAQAVRPDEHSPVLLLGDSFTNIYSAKPMGWGSGAGLAEHLSYHLGRTIDWIARNDAGAHATREILQGQAAQGRDRLHGKQVVIWQFAARELALGDWKRAAHGAADCRAPAADWKRNQPRAPVAGARR